MYGFYVSFKLKVISQLHFESVPRFCNCNNCNAKFARKTLGTLQYYVFFYLVFFRDHSRITGLQGKGEGMFLTSRCHFHPLHGHLVISRATAAESSPLRIGSGRTQTGNLWFPGSDR